MRKCLMIAAISAVFYALVGAAAICPAQMVGNYRETSKTDETVFSAADFAVKTQSKTLKDASLKLISIERAERQVVAGSNYRLCLAVNSKEKPQQATAVIYYNLHGEFSLTSWTPGQCATAAKTNQATPPAAQIMTPDAVVRNLYQVQKTDKGPFFQTKSRAAVDKFFTKKLADLIWKDAITADGVGALDFDPLYHAQDTKIVNFKIGKPEYGEGNSELADVPVTFKNMGKNETILFRLMRDGKSKNWKISNISYPSTGDSLDTILSGA